MKFSIFLWLLPLTRSFQLHSNKYPVYSLHTVKQNIDIPIKIKHFTQLIRAESILPTSLLCFTGGFIINPSIIGLLQTPSFLISTVNTILIMSSSMIVNDIFDVKNDRIDHPERPLVNGNITILDAIGYLFGLLSLIECLSMRFLPDNLQTIVHVSILNIILYTPIYKKIPFIKNMFCAGMVAFSIIFSGLAASNRELIIVNPRFSIFSVALSILFFGSWYNEVLLDMGDIVGDKENHIYTVPVLYGNHNAWLFSGFLLFFNILSNTLSMYYLFGLNTAIWLPCIFSPMVYHFWKLYTSKYKREVIKYAVKNMKTTLFTLVIFLCGLSFIHSGYAFPSIQWDIHWMTIATTVFT